ncbi:hypothetical protein HETIRDRAFT_432044, partial [Heterobasidion irregulare TC 32-1]
MAALVDSQPLLLPLHGHQQQQQQQHSQQQQQQQQQQPLQGVNKRYRPAPAKTFQCRGYGDCRMVFSRSEHLARHIRKHTGERPFTCHCGKQFSRLDNLRQHAQTVHADKQEQNERMMRDLTSLHATMAAANKATQQRGKRSTHPNPSNNDIDSQALQPDIVKQEDIQHPLPLHQRPGTSTGYEGSGPDSNGLLYNSAAARSWHVQTNNVDRPNSRPVNSHSFRDPTQSFRAPPAPSSAAPSASSAAASSAQQQQQQQQQQQTQSFLASGDAFQFGVPDLPGPRRDARPGSSASRPSTASRDPSDAHTRSLPPLASVVSSSLASSQWSVAPQSLFPLPSGPGIGGPGRPSTATRPGTAPAAYYSSHPAFGPGLASRSELPFPALYGRPELAPPHTLALPQPQSFAHGPSAYPYPASGFPSVDAGDIPTSPVGYDSPFSFHPPGLADQQQQQQQQHSPSSVPRKRPFPGSDEDLLLERGTSSYGAAYEFASSESRPQSRRLSVMELCNDTDADPATRPFLPLSATAAGAGAGAPSPSAGRPGTSSGGGSAAAASRPTTSSGLVASASQLALVDPPQSLFGGPAPAAAAAAFANAGASTAATAAAGAGAARAGAQGFARG